MWPRAQIGPIQTLRFNLLRLAPLTKLYFWKTAAPITHCADVCANQSKWKIIIQSEASASSSRSYHSTL